MNSVFSKVTAVTAVFLVMLLLTAGGAQNPPDQKIWTQYCVASPDSTCFDPVNGAIDSVGRDVGELAGNFRFCLTVDTIDSGYAPVRVSLVLDNSRSMCENPGGNCCVIGDSSGECMNNDPDDKRIEAAHVFVDSLRALNPQSEVAVVIFSGDASGHGPLSLETDENVQQVHSWIDNAGCSNRPGLGTNLGLGLQDGLSLVDKNYDELPPFMTRHIILLTDGAWDDVQTRSPEAIFENYAARYPDRVLPTIHGVFISDSLTHVQHGYPWQGCAGGGLVDLSHLQYTAETTGGLYFPGSRPETVIDNFQTLLDSVVQSAPQMLGSLTVTNTTNGAISTNGTIRQVGSMPTWETTLKSLPLDFGPNVLSVKRVINLPGRGDSTVTTSVTIIRSDRYRESLDSDLFKEYCELVNASIKITATPDTQAINTPVSVTAVISDASKFHVSQVQTRLLTRFPDSDNGVLATFHLDGDLTNATNPGSNGTGTPSFTSTSKLFGTGAISSGNFLYNIPALADAFVFEEWVKPSTGAGVLISGGGIEFGIDATSHLYLKNESGVIISAVVPLDAGVWTHVAVARQGGLVVLFINGSAVSDAVSFTAPVTAGALTFSVPNRWVVDEIRISNIGKIQVNGTERNLALSVLPNPSWTLLENQSTSALLSVPVNAWVNGTSLGYAFSSPVYGTVVVNMYQAQSGSSIGTGWSKNGNPVLIISDQQGPYVKKGTLTPVVEGDMDTLGIKFNELIRCDSLRADPSVAGSFEFLNGGKIRLEFARDAKYIDECPESNLIDTITLVVPVGLIPGRDSVRLVGRAVDAAGNKPDMDSIGPIVWGDGKGIKVIPIDGGPNLTIDQTTKDILGISQPKGKVVTLKTVVPLMPADTIGGDTITYGKAMIYDAVGNVIINDLNVLESDVPRTYYVVWNGLNRNNRRVGAGGYYILFAYKQINGKKSTEGKKFLLKWK